AGCGGRDHRAGQTGAAAGAARALAAAPAGGDASGAAGDPGRGARPAAAHPARAAARAGAGERLGGSARGGAARAPRRARARRGRAARAGGRGRRRGAPAVRGGPPGAGRARRCGAAPPPRVPGRGTARRPRGRRSEEHTSELQSRENLVCRLLLEKKNVRKRRRAPAPLVTPPVALRCSVSRPTATTETHTLSLHDALPILRALAGADDGAVRLLCAAGLLELGERDGAVLLHRLAFPGEEQLDGLAV